LLLTEAAGTTGHVLQQVVTTESLGRIGRGRSPAWLARAAMAGSVGLAAQITHEGIAFVVQWRLSRVVTDALVGAVLDAASHLDLEDLSDPAIQDELQGRLSDAMRAGATAGAVLRLPGSVATSLVTLVRLARRDHLLGAVVAASAVPMVLLQNRFDTFDGADSTARRAAGLRATLTGPAAAPELLLFQSQDFLRRRYDELTRQEALRQHERLTRLRRSNTRRAAARRLLRGPALARLARRAVAGGEGLAEATADALAVQQGASAALQVGGAVGSLRWSGAPLIRVNSFLGRQPEVQAGRQPEAAARDAVARLEHLRVEGLSFAYRGASSPVLDGVDLDLRRGETVALVGENGSGKTTLAKVLCHLLRPTGGRILWNGTDTARLDPSSLSRQISAVFQTFQRYLQLSIRDNIAIGDPIQGSDPAAIETAALAAGAHDFIERLPDGYDTVASRLFGGVDLSVGQWQRIAAARAFLRDASLVILDEPTAALDPRAERALFEVTSQLHRDRAVLLISHRLTTVRAADRICVLADGTVCEEGSHDALLSAGGRYADLYELQSRPFREG